MAELKTGDGVMVVTRDVTPEDMKSGLYYVYFGGLIGKVDRIYDDGNVCINIDIDSLSTEARKRHLAMQEAERKRWLENLSGEARNRLTDEQKKLRISYKLLVAKTDLEPYKGGVKPKGTPAIAAEASQESADAPDPAIEGRLTEADLAAREEEFLKSLQDRQE